jgi:hypothetical protein
VLICMLNNVLDMSRDVLFTISVRRCVLPICMDVVCVLA